MADDFRHRHAVGRAGGTTTVIPFAASTRASRCAPRWTTTTGAPKAKPVIDYAFHLIVSDPTAGGAAATSCPR